MADVERCEREVRGTAPIAPGLGPERLAGFGTGNKGGSEAQGWMDHRGSGVRGGSGTCSALATPLLSRKSLWGLSGRLFGRGPPKARI